MVDKFNNDTLYQNDNYSDIDTKYKDLKLSHDHSAMVLVDVFRGQCTNELKLSQAVFRGKSIYELKLSHDHSALVLVDVFRGQCTYELKLSQAVFRGKNTYELKLSHDHSALVLVDVFKGQCTMEILKLLYENNTLYVLMPANCTDRLQPLDLRVNKSAKDWQTRVSRLVWLHYMQAARIWS